jgi:hypothetical protein
LNNYRSAGEMLAKDLERGFYLQVDPLSKNPPT